MVNVLCQSLMQLSYHTRHGFSEIMTSEEREVMSKIKPIKYNFPKTHPLPPSTNFKDSKQGIAESLEEIRDFLDKNTQEVDFSYLSYAYNLVTFAKTPKAKAIDTMVNLISKAYSDISTCIDSGKISLLFQPNGILFYNFHIDDPNRSSKAHLATIMFPLIGDATIVVPHGQEKYCNLVTAANCTETPVNNAVTFIARGSQPTYHSAPQTEEPRIAIFFTDLDVTGFINQNNLNECLV